MHSTAATDFSTLLVKLQQNITMQVYTYLSEINDNAVVQNTQILLRVLMNNKLSLIEVRNYAQAGKIISCMLILCLEMPCYTSVQ